MYKVLIALCAVLALVQFAWTFERSEIDYKNLFDAWSAQYKKTYAGNEAQVRYQVFKQNQKFIDEHNAKLDKSHTLAMNQFGDMTLAEYKVRMLPKRDRSQLSAATIKPLPFVSALKQAPPASYDWRQHNAVTPVKDQGQCGSCWAFGTVCNIEGLNAIKSGKLVSLSEQQLVDCDKSNEGCNGGFPSLAMEYVIKNQGIDTEQCYPYHSGFNAPNRCQYKTTCIGAKISKYYNVTRGNENALLNATSENGPVTVSINADSSHFQFYKSGVLVVPRCPTDYDSLDHAVCVVGWGNENGQDYWLVKNSWGTSWGNAGYVKMARNHQNMCGIATDAQFAQE